MAPLDLVALPVRLTVAAVDTTLALGEQVAEDGTLDRLVALGRTLEHIQPRIAELIALISELHRSVDTLSESVGPLSDLANRIPGGRRRTALEV
jgi:hypothetical protein